MKIWGKFADFCGNLDDSTKRKYQPPMDMLIGAHTKSLGMILVTNNTREFERITDLRVENWV